ncbi:phosphotransferase family protein [Kineosporia succinea]|uniref:Aminoglycoside phosphotransferase (APT) family kinase protein n=1 Tax=Kineosporia succinea TaxID=84632 RepID=A0ABT9PEJ3_9ACTN|nr:phosphotransferase family protein [Kineosporia succinea]MDP9831130.1 aminoglycoside phosphotransferase (APT) family kinase protein [Kineosporia succinea]
MIEGPTPGLDVPLFESWLRQAHPALGGAGPLAATLMTGGRSNVTYGITGAARPLVLRRPPLGHVQATAHDMSREHRVISALRGTAVPVPEALALQAVPDASTGVDAPFFLMSREPGHVLARRHHNAGHTPEQLRRVSLELVRLLAELHRLDPAAVGLSDFGRPGGYLERQLHRWGLQYDGSRSRDLPALDRLQRRLRERVPGTVRTGLVHGDFRLDNTLVQVDGDASPIRAILDWELSSLGDTAVDIGLLGLYWEINLISPHAAFSAVDPEAGYPSFAELLDTYGEILGTRVEHLSWYRAFAAYKLAVILEGVHFRHRAGGTVGEGFETVGDLAVPLAEHGLSVLSQA